MTSLLSRAIDAIRVLLGLNDPTENHLHAPHGWLLPPSADVRARAVEPGLTLAPVPAPSDTGKGR